MLCCFFFFFNDTATTEIYTLSLHDALPILLGCLGAMLLTLTATLSRSGFVALVVAAVVGTSDRKSTRLNSSHVRISYAVFCLKKKKCTLAGIDEAPTTAICLGASTVSDRSS